MTLSEDQLAAIAASKTSTPSHFHEPVTALGQAGVADPVRCLESLRDLGLIVPTADVVDGSSRVSIYRWVRKEELGLVR